MADIRINALATTATASASDDYLAIDGTANGTRKLSAYSPTFGGNLTVSGNSTLGSGNTYPIYGYSGYFQFAGLTAGKFAAAGTYRAHAGVGSDSFSIQLYNGSAWTEAANFGSTSTNIGGNLTVSGTGTSSVAGSFVVGQGSSSGVVYFGNPSNNYLFQDGSAFYLRAGGSDRLTVINSSGNLLLGTTTDQGYRLGINGASDKQLILDVAAGGRYTSMYWANAGTIKVVAYWDNVSSGFQFGTNLAGSAMYLQSGGTTALTLDSSQNATFAGATVNVSKAGNNPALKATDGLIITKLQSLTAGDTAGWVGTESNHTFRIVTNNTTAASFDTSQNATFAGSVQINSTVGAYVLSSSVAKLRIQSTAASGKDWLVQSYNDGSFYVTHNGIKDAIRAYPTTGNVDIGGAIAINNTVAAAVGVASTHKVTISIGGTTYYLLASNV